MDDTFDGSDDDEMSLITQYLEWLRQRGLSARTIEAREYVLTRADRELPQGLEVANADELAGWLYRDDWSLHTKETWYAALASFFGWACDPRDARLDHNPVEYLAARPQAPRGIPRPVTDETLHRVLTEAAQPYRLWALIAAYQGLRCIEIAGLDREHITDSTLTVVRGKGGKPRTGITHPDVWAAVRDFPPGPIARLPDGQRADARYISLRTAVYLRRDMGLPGVSMHRFRHWYGVTVQALYKDIRVTQELLGHESLQSTQVYTMASAEQMRAAIGMLPRLA